MTRPYSSDGEPHMTLGEFLELVKDLPKDLEVFVSDGFGIRKVIRVERTRFNNNTVYNDIIAIYPH